MTSVPSAPVGRSTANWPFESGAFTPLTATVTAVLSAAVPATCTCAALVTTPGVGDVIVMPGSLASMVTARSVVAVRPAASVATAVIVREPSASVSWAVNWPVDTAAATPLTCTWTGSPIEVVPCTVTEVEPSTAPAAGDVMATVSGLRRTLTVTDCGALLLPTASIAVTT